jgi:D-alanine--poly(phosphoribitol) ligase subunit 2
MTTSSQSDLESSVAALVAQVVQTTTGRAVQIAVEDRLIEKGILDSLSTVNLVLALESEFGVCVDVMEVDEDNFGSAAAIARLVGSRR